MRLTFLLLVLLSLTGQVLAGETLFSAGGKFTAGTNQYRGTDWWGQIRYGDVRFRPSISSYHTHNTSGTYKTYSARLSYDTGHYGLGVSVGGTPKQNGYRKSFYSIDGNINIWPPPSTTKPRVEDSQESHDSRFSPHSLSINLGGSFKHITHTDDFQTVAGQDDRHGGRVTLRQVPLEIRQNDLTIMAEMALDDVVFNVDVTKSVYDKDLNTISARSAQVVDLSGIDSTIQGFPDTSYYSQISLEMIDYFIPSFSFVRTKYVLAQPDSNAITLAVDVPIKKIMLKASYERFSQTGTTSLNYTSLGASYKF